MLVPDHCCLQQEMPTDICRPGLQMHHDDHELKKVGWEIITVDSETGCGVVVWHNHMELETNAKPRLVWVGNGSNFKNNDYTTMNGTIAKITTQGTKFLRRASPPTNMSIVMFWSEKTSSSETCMEACSHL